MEAISIQDATLSTPADGSLFQKRIEFHPARNHYSGIPDSGGDFQLETLNPAGPGRQRHCAFTGPSGKKQERPDVFENGLDPELNFGMTFRRIGAGLQNLGNTCFLNSVLQCLTYTEPLAAYLQSGKHQSSCRIVGFCALCAIQKHVSCALQSSGRIVAPNHLVSNLRRISRDFQSARQEDAHEYMINLLESMHKCCLPSGVPSESSSAYEKSLVHKIFGGSLRSQVKCLQCSHCSNKFDPFLDLSLEIIKADSLQKALKHFTCAEQLDGGERQYQCQRCKQKVKALKQLTVHKAPYVLTIHLKRFRAYDRGQKIDKQVHFFPTLDLKPFVSGSYEGDLRYTLYGVLVHAGWSTHSGHYYCFVRTSSGMWYSLDDNRVFQVNERTVLEQKAYMLFYVRDRRNFASKKPVKVVSKENGAGNPMVDRSSFPCGQGLKETVKNGPVERSCNGAVTANGSCHEVAKSSGSSHAFEMKEVNDPPKGAEKPLPMSKPLMESSIKANNEGGLTSVGSQVHAPDIAAEVDNFVVEKTAAKALNNNWQNDLKKDLGSSVPAKLDAKCINCKCEVNLKNGRDSLDTSTVNCNGYLNTAVDRLVNGSISEKVDEYFNPNTTGNSPKGEAATNDREVLTSTINGSVGVQRTPVMMDGAVHVVAENLKPHWKARKKHLKCRAPTMHLGSSILFGPILSLRKKTKHNSRRRSNKEREKIIQEHLETDMGPSTSEKTHTCLAKSTRIRRKKLRNKHSGKLSERASNVGENSNISKKPINSNINSFLVDVKKELINRNGHNEVMIGNCMLPEENTSPNLKGSHCDVGVPDSQKDGNHMSVQNGFVTRGLDEIFVAQWDGIDLPPSDNMESTTTESTRIGYVLDDWDEEYDRGKRKKVRQNRHNFSGPNPFQEISSKKAKLKKMKTSHSSFGNQPMRI